VGDIVFARVCPPETSSLGGGSNTYAQSGFNKVSYDGIELSCISATTGKAEGMGPLKGGMVFDISLSLARKLIRGKKSGGVEVLDVLGEKVEFECVVGRNGRLWVSSGNAKVVMLVGRVVQRLDGLEAKGKVVGGEEQRRIVDEIARKLA
jgi:exosome complex component RRP40